IAAGLLAPVTEVHYGEEALLQLNLESAARYPSFVDELEDLSGLPAGYERSGMLCVARDSDENAAMEELYRFQQELGLDVERLRGSECRELEPALSPRVRGGTFVEGDHQIDNRALLPALYEACRRSAVQMRAARVAEIVCKQGRVSAVVLDDGEEVPCGTVVLAAGSWSGQIRGIPEHALPPVRPVKGQLIHLRGPHALVSRNVRGLDVYIVPRRDGRVVVGATVEEQGFDLSVTAGAIYTLLRDAYEILPGITELEVTETVAGLRPASPDNHPIIGATAVEGLVVATAHFRNGILLAPVTADAIVELLTTGTAPELVAPFSPLRFAPTEETVS
ncbi:MAG: glycine oxidase ThiO, partial [Actinomycetota bacterium]